MGRILGPSGTIDIAEQGFFGNVTPAVPHFIAVGSDSSAGASSVPLLSIRSAGPGGTWTPESVGGAFGANGLFSVVHALSQWLAATDSGTSGASVIGTSPDGIHWTPQTNPDPGRNLLALGGDTAFANIGGNGQTLATSADGVTWTDTSSFLSGSFVVAASAAGGGNYVITGTGSGSANHGFSANGTTWATSSFSTLGGTAVIWDGVQFVTVCTNTGGQAIIATSPTGVTWTPSAPLTFTGATVIAWNGARYVLAGGANVATAGTLAALVTASSFNVAGTNIITAITAGGGLFVAVDNFCVAYSSSNGTSWTTESTGLSSADQLNAIAFG